MKKSVIAAQNAGIHGEKETKIYVKMLSKKSITECQLAVAMSKFDENSKCHFFDIECQYPITEDALIDLLEDTEEGEVISKIPEMGDLVCTNYLLATLIDMIAKKLE